MNPLDIKSGCLYVDMVMGTLYWDVGNEENPFLIPPGEPFMVIERLREQEDITSHISFKILYADKVGIFKIHKKRINFLEEVI